MIEVIVSNECLIFDELVIFEFHKTSYKKVFIFFRELSQSHIGIYIFFYIVYYNIRVPQTCEYLLFFYIIFHESYLNLDIFNFPNYIFYTKPFFIKIFLPKIIPVERYSRLLS